jgi:hypothetical protein
MIPKFNLSITKLSPQLIRQMAMDVKRNKAKKESEKKAGA